MVNKNINISQRNIKGIFIFKIKPQSLECIYLPFLATLRIILQNSPKGARGHCPSHTKCTYAWYGLSCLSFHKVLFPT